VKRLIASFLVATIALPAIAQDSEIDRERDRFLRPDIQTGTRFKQEPEMASETDARQMQKRLARCVFYAKKEELNTLLANSDFDRIDFDATEFETEEFFDQIKFSRCLGRAMKASQYKIYASMRYSTLRNLVAEEAYLYANKDAPVREEGAPTLIEQRFAYLSGGARSAVLAEVSDCISYRNSAAAHELLDSTPGSSVETAALEALYPTLLTCLETDTPPAFSTSMVRLMIADGMWARSYYDGFTASMADAEVAE